MGMNITMGPDGLQVPAEPVIPFIEGDGIGPDIWAASVRVFDAAVEKAYGGDRKVAWKEVLAGEKAFNETGSWLPEETVAAFSDQLVGIKGPLTTPVGGGIRSLNVALRQIMDLYACVRPVRWFEGVPSPVKDPGRGRHGDLPREHRGRLRRQGARAGDRGGRESSSPSSRRLTTGTSVPTPASGSSRCR